MASTHVCFIVGLEGEITHGRPPQWRCGLLPPPALGERRHGSLACCRMSVRLYARDDFKDRPEPSYLWRSAGGGVAVDAADDHAIRKHVKVVVIPLPGGTRSRGALEREIVFVHVSAAAHRPRPALRLYREQKTSSQKCLDPPPRRRLRRTATGRRAKQDRASWRPFPLPVERGKRPRLPPKRESM